MKFWDWTFGRLGKENNYHPKHSNKGSEVRTNKGKWVQFFRGYYWRVDNIDYSKVDACQ